MASVAGIKFNGVRKTLRNAWDQTSGSTGGYVPRTSGITIDYEVMDADDADDAVDTTYLHIRDTLGEIQIDDMTLQSVSCREEQGNGWFVVSAEYSVVSGNSGSQGGDGGETFAFDTTGGTAKITQSLETVDATFPDNRGAIGDTGTEVTGVDVIVPQFQFSKTVWLDDDDVTQAYRLQVNDLTGTVNDAAFEGFEAGEVLFLGARGNRSQGSTVWEIQFNFAARKNETNLSAGDLTIPAKKGWEYLWFRYGTVVIPEGGGIEPYTVQAPVAYYVEKVYEDGDFSLLGI